VTRVDRAAPPFQDALVMPRRFDIREPGATARRAGLDPVLGLYARHFGIDLAGDPRFVLGNVLRCFARLPYENLSKIVRHAQGGDAAASRRDPQDVVCDHIDLGAGGTCFSLTATLCHLVRALGFAAEPILADRHYGVDTHCALLVWIDGRAHLVDPGFLIVDPVPLLGDGEQEIETSFHTVRLVPEAAPGKVALHTVQDGAASHRLTLKTDPVDWGDFCRAWDTSFGWEMMRQPLLTTVVAGAHLYVRGKHWQTRSRHTVQRARVSDEEWVQAVARTFAIDRRLVESALRVLRESEGDDGGA